MVWLNFLGPGQQHLLLIDASITGVYTEMLSWVM